MAVRGSLRNLLAGPLAVALSLGSVPQAWAATGPASDKGKPKARPAAEDAAEAPAQTEGDAPHAEGDAPQAEGDAPADEAPDGDAPAEGDTEPAPDVEPPEPEPPSDRDRAAAAFREGTRAYELGKYQEAIAKFEKAWELAPEPALLFNMGQAQWRWFNIDKDIEHLRKARTLFENYDKRMRAREDYFPGEAQAFIRALEIQIEAEEHKLAEANRPVIVGPSVEELEEAEKRKERRERALRTAERMNAAGIALIVVGSVTAAVAIGGVAARQAYKLILDNTTGGGDPNTPNKVSAEEDERRRNGFLAAGQVAYGSLIATAILLPVGIGLRVGGAVIERRELGAPKRRGKKDRGSSNVEASVRPGALLTIEF